MTTPLQTIKSGIIENDMNQVRLGYFQMTGEQIYAGEATELNEVNTELVDPPEPKIEISNKSILKARKKDLVAMCEQEDLDFKKSMSVADLRMLLLDTLEPKEIVVEPEVVPTKTKFKNVFHDDGSIAPEEKEVDQILLGKNKPVDRSRTSKILVKCFECNRESMQYATQVVDKKTFMCPDCSKHAPQRR